MIFPFTIKYTQRLSKGLSDDETLTALNRIKAIIEDESADDIEIKKDELIFRVNLLGLRWNWNIMVPIEKGEIKISRTDKETTLTYEIFMFRLAIITIIMSLIIGLVSKSTGTAIFVFSFLFGINWLFAVIRHNGLLVDIVSELKSMKL